MPRGNEDERPRDEVRTRNAELEAVFRALPDQLFEIDRDGVIGFYRAGRAEDLYARPDDFLGKRLADVMPSQTSQLIQSAIDRVMAGEALARIEYELAMPGGVKHFEARVVSLDGTKAIAVVRDLTELRRAQEERLRLDRKLQEAQRLESLGLLAGGIAHDLNNMLAAILGGADLIARHAPDGSVLDAPLEIVRHSAWRASELCRQLLAYAGKGRMEMRHVDLGALVLDTAQLLGSAISKRVRLELELEPELPAVHADAAQLRQVLMNLLMNASDALAGRDGRVVLRTRRDGAEESEPSVVIEVEDEGAGMDETTRARMFDPFFTTKGPGRGLGLAAVIGIVRSHGGHLDVDSAPGRGTRVRVVLPASDQPADPLDRPTTSTPAPIGPGTVLVADDEPAVREVVTRLLEDAGMTVIVARDGAEALERFAGGVVDLAIVDVTMPSLAGDGVFHALRRVDPDLPVILMSGYSERDASTAEEPLGHPPVFLQKPFSAAMLRDTVRSALRAHARGRSGS